MGLFNHENLQVSCYKDKKTCRFIKGFRKLICSISEIKRTFKGRLIIGGMLVSTFLTLVVVPVMYKVLHGFEHDKKPETPNIESLMYEA